jgi:hypothetical protein
MKLLLQYGLGFLDGSQETESGQERKKEKLKVNKQGNTLLVSSLPVPRSGPSEAKEESLS